MSNPEYDVDELVQDPSFRAWVTGEADKQEKIYWDRWVQESEDNRMLVLQAQRKITGFSFDAASVPNTAEAWKKIDDRIVRKAHHQRSPYPRKRGMRWIYAAAASLLLAAMVGMAYWASFYDMGSSAEDSVAQKVVTRYGQQKKIQLSDGSTIVLNAHSTLRYTAHQSMETGVRIFLDGEAYFKVASRTDSTQPPFTVITDDGSIAVRGTRFAVSTRSPHTRVVLEHGKVVIQPGEKSSSPKMASVLHLDEMAIFEAGSDEVEIQPVNTAIYTSWTTDELVFDHTPFAEVKKRLEYTFGKKVIVRDPDLLQRPISGSISNANAEVIVTALANILNTEVVIGPERILFGNNTALTH